MRANGFNRAHSLAFNETDCSILFLLSSWLWYFHSGAANINSLWLILLECCTLPKKCEETVGKNKSAVFIRARQMWTSVAMSHTYFSDYATYVWASVYILKLLSRFKLFLFETLMAYKYGGGLIFDNSNINSVVKSINTVQCDANSTAWASKEAYMKQGMCHKLQQKPQTKAAKSSSRNIDCS